QLSDQSCCCSWTRLCDVMGNRQNLFIQSLRPMKIHLTLVTMQNLASLEIELERGMRTYKNTKKTSDSVHHLIKHINAITSDSILNVPPYENEMFRNCATNLTVLARIIDQLIREDEARRREQRDHDQSETEQATTSTPRSPSEDESTFNFRGRQMKHAASGQSAVDEHSLKDRIEKNMATLESLLKFVDKKTQRRWWLRDVINFAQVRDLAVFYPTENVGEDGKPVEVFPIVTLALSIAQGVIEVMDQYFLKNKSPDDIKIDVVAALAAA
ncbi:hypothetical protein PENTCL1PPCAC_20992, partial [Pristionchus entomophagus]